MRIEAITHHAAILQKKNNKVMKLKSQVMSRYHAVGLLHSGVLFSLNKLFRIFFCMI